MGDSPESESPETRATSKNFGAVLSGSFARSVLLVVQGLVVSRFLGPRGYGEFSLALAFVTLVFGVVDFRVQHAVIKFMADAEDRPPKVRHLLGFVFLSFEVVKGVLGFLGTIGFGYLYLIYVQKSPESLPILWSLAAYKLAMTANPTTTAFLRLASKYRAIAVYDLLFAVLSILVVGLAAAGTGEVLAVARAYLAVGLVGGVSKSLLSWWLLRPPLAVRSLIVLVSGWRQASLPWREILRFVVGVNLAATCRIAAKNLDTLILGRFVAFEVVGWYSLAKRLKSLFGYVTDPLLIVLYPEFARAWASDRLVWLKATLRRTTLWGFSLSVLGFVALASASRLLVPRVFGESFDAASVILWFFALDAVANAGFFAYPHLVLAMGRAGDILRGALARVVTVVLVGYLATAVWGAGGMALAVGLASLVNMLVLARATRRGLDSKMGANKSV